MADLKDTVGGAVRSAEFEAKKLIQQFNDDIVPAIRKEGAGAMKAAAEQLRALAAKLEK